MRVCVSFVRIYMCVVIFRHAFGFRPSANMLIWLVSVAPCMQFKSNCLQACVCVCVCVYRCKRVGECVCVSWAFDGMAGACLMWLLAGVGWNQRGGNVEPLALILSILQQPDAPPQTWKDQRNPPLNPLDNPPLPHPVFSESMTSSFAQRRLERWSIWMHKRATN